MGRSSDLEAGGGGFDSRPPEVIFGSPFREFWDVLGCVWEWSGDVFRQVWEGFEKKCPTGSENQNVQNCQGVFSLSWGASE